MRKRVLEYCLSVCMYVCVSRWRMDGCMIPVHIRYIGVYVLYVGSRLLMKFPALKLGIFTGSTKHKVVIFSKTPETIFI
jgi:hypothetical protein